MCVCIGDFPSNKNNQYLCSPFINSSPFITQIICEHILTVKHSNQRPNKARCENLPFLSPVSALRFGIHCQPWSHLLSGPSQFLNDPHVCAPTYMAKPRSSFRSPVGTPGPVSLFVTIAIVSGWTVIYSTIPWLRNMGAVFIFSCCLCRHLCTHVYFFSGNLAGHPDLVCAARVPASS